MSKLPKKWENDKGSYVHSPVGVKDLRNKVRYALNKYYGGIAQAMWRYDGMDAPVFEDMRLETAGTFPEKLLLKNGQCVWFKYEPTDQIYCLPLTFDGGINIFGTMNRWHPVPVGYDDMKRGTYDANIEAIRDLDLSYGDSVIMRNDIYGGNDEGYIHAMVDELVDNVLTMNQLQLIAKSPFVFNVTDDTINGAKNFFLAMAEDKPAIFVQNTGDKPYPVLESTQMKIDPALFELYDRFECQILEYIGFPCVPITKRAQQSVSEVQSNNDKIYARRMEKLRQRELACERINALWGTDLHCVSVIDERLEQAEKALENDKERDFDVE